MSDFLHRDEVEAVLRSVGMTPECFPRQRFVVAIDFKDGEEAISVIGDNQGVATRILTELREGRKRQRFPVSQPTQELLDDIGIQHNLLAEEFERSFDL